MTAAEQSADAKLAEVAQDRTKLLADLARARVESGDKLLDALNAPDAEPATSHLADLAGATWTGRLRAALTARPWQVVAQRSSGPDEVVSAHRFEWVADWSMVRRAWRNNSVDGVHLTVRRAS